MTSHTRARKREPQETHRSGEHNWHHLSPQSLTEGEAVSPPCVKAPYISLIRYHKKCITNYKW